MPQLLHCTSCLEWQASSPNDMVKLGIGVPHSAVAHSFTISAPPRACQRIQAARRRHLMPANESLASASAGACQGSKGGGRRRHLRKRLQARAPPHTCNLACMPRKMLHSHVLCISAFPFSSSSFLCEHSNSWRRIHVAMAHRFAMLSPQVMAPDPTCHDSQVRAIILRHDHDPTMLHITTPSEHGS